MRDPVILDRPRCRAARTMRCVCVAALTLAAGATDGFAQPPAMPRVTFDEAVRRAVERNPSAAIAAAQILRAEALMRQTRAATLLSVMGNVTSTTLNRSVEFDGTEVTPRNQLGGAIDLGFPLFAPAAWARRTQARDVRDIADLGAAETRRQTALAAADAYLSIIARRRVVEANERARDVAKAHFDFAHTQQVAGTGSLLNELRAQQELSADEVLVESSRLALYRAQEALGVLLNEQSPIDASDEPVFEIPSDAQAAAPVAPQRADLRLIAARVGAAERIVRDSQKDWLPTVRGVVQPQFTYPSQFFLPSRSWRALVLFDVPIIDSGQRAGVKAERTAALDETRAQLTGAETQARSEVRAAREAVRSAEAGLTSARAAADQARRVVDIVNVSFRAGAATNIEVIDAERRARDADTAAAVAEDSLRRAKLELLTAVGSFPR
jgi:outer membrane protein TolC